MKTETTDLTENRIVTGNNKQAKADSNKKPPLKESYSKKDRWLRSRMAVQAGFVITCIWLGWKFSGFIHKLLTDAPVTVAERPPGVEGILPISSLMEFWLWLKTGIPLYMHPAGVVIIVFAIVSAFLMRRGFCSWLCPVGTLSEFISRLGVKTGVSFKPTKWIDIPLRSLKYLLLAFFLYAILGMTSDGLVTFLMGEYNRVSDIKMYNFFAPPSRMTFSIIGILALLTLMVKNFWCRYLCPYGALLGIFSRISPMAIRRDIDTCIDCDKCNKVCPSFLPVATSKSVVSEECLACHQCTEICPVKDCLTFSTPKKRLRFTPVMYGIVFLLLYLGAVSTAKVAGYWQGHTTIEQYRDLAKKSDILDHPKSLKGY